MAIYYIVFAYYNFLLVSSISRAFAIIYEAIRTLCSCPRKKHLITIRSCYKLSACFKLLLLLPPSPHSQSRGREGKTKFAAAAAASSFRVFLPPSLILISAFASCCCCCCCCWMAAILKLQLSVTEYSDLLFVVGRLAQVNVKTATDTQQYLTVHVCAR